MSVWWTQMVTNGLDLYSCFQFEEIADLTCKTDGVFFVVAIGTLGGIKHW